MNEDLKTKKFSRDTMGVPNARINTRLPNSDTSFFVVIAYASVTRVAVAVRSAAFSTNVGS